MATLARKTFRPTMDVGQRAVLIDGSGSVTNVLGHYTATIRVPRNALVNGQECSTE